MKRTTWVWLLLGAVWGSTWLFIKLGLENVPPFSLAGLRFLFASAAMWGYLSIRRVRLPRSLRNWALMIGAGLLTFALDYGLVFWGENQISAGLTAILFSTMPLFALLLAHLMVPTERMTRRKLAGILVGISGVTVIFSRQLQISDTLALWGAIAVLAAAAFAGLSSVLIRRHGTHIDPAVLTTVQMTAGFVPLLAIGLALEGSPLSFQWTPMAWVSLLYGVRRIGAVRSDLIIPFSTVVAVLLGVVILNGTFHLANRHRRSLGDSRPPRGLSTFT